MGALALWLSVAAACALLVLPRTRNSGWFGLAGSAMGALVHYDFATVPEALTIARLLWAFALFLLAAKTLPKTLARPLVASLASLRRRSA